MAPSNRLEPLEPTYTPTTRRISKAKKGKRVHVCDKCEKVCCCVPSSCVHELDLPTAHRFLHGPSISGECAFGMRWQGWGLL